MNPAALSALEEQRNDSLGSPLNNLSPFWIDIIAITVLLMVYFYGQSGTVIALGVIVACVLMLWCALRANAYYHFIIDTPKSKITSASQGFVELHGTCDLYGNRQTQGFLTGPPCVWHRYAIWSLRPIPFQTGASTLPFSLTDETGTCTVDPKGARIISSSRRTWIAEGKRYSSKYIHPGASVYILGELRTRRADSFQYKKGVAVSKLLSVWKKDRRWLVDEFDHNGDGRIDSNEWESVRARAEKVSLSLHNQRTIDAADQVIGCPSNGMPFIIADRDPAVLGMFFRVVSVGNVLVAVLCFAWLCLRFF